MAGKPSADMEKVMHLIQKGSVPIDAARQIGIAPSTLYRSRLYKMWRAAQSQAPAASPLRQRK